jgi:HEAT repeat protein
MKSAVDDLVTMKDVESLFEIMNEDDDWMTQMDAAEGLIQLGDRRGLEYLLIAKQSDIDDVQEAATEILADPETKRMREQIEAELRFASQKLVESARERLSKGKKVFLHKVIQISAAEFIQDDPSGEGFQIYGLNDAGLEGWEVVNILPRRQLVAPGESSPAGAYVFLRKQLNPDEAAELG